VSAEAPPDRSRAAFVLAATVSLAACGPLLVVRDRWLGLRQSNRYLSAFAERFPFLADFNLPDYAAVIAGVFFLLFLLGRFRAAEVLPLWRSRRAFARRSRRPTATGAARTIGNGLALAGGGAAAFLFARLAATKRLPGLDLFLALCLLAAGLVLREVSVAALLRLWRQKRGIVLSIVAAHAAVILALTARYSLHRFEIPLAALALAAVVNLAARYRKTGPIPLVVLFFVGLYCWHINAWWYVLVGDEYRNYELATAIVRHHDAKFIARHLFQLEGGLEGLDPYADSLAQAVSMRLLGVNNFGWRFSSLYFAAVSLAFFFRFFRTFLTRRTAIVTTVALGASHYVMSFGKIGYDKFQAYLAMSLLLASTACAIRTRRTLAYAFIGFAAALCFYVYPAALYIVPFAFFLLLLYAPPVDRSTAVRWALAGLVTVLVVFPLPFQPTYFEGKRPGTVFYNPELSRSARTLLPHFGRNLAYAAYSPVILGSEDHFVTGSYLDPVTGMFFLAGLSSALWLVRRDAFLAFLAVGLVWLLFFGGATHDREYPPTTRMFLMLPILLPFATFGLARVLFLARGAGLSTRASGVALWTTVAGIVAANVVQTHVVSVRRSDSYELFDPLVVRMARRIENLGWTGGSLLFLAQIPGEGGGIPLVLEVYSLPSGDFAEIAAPEGTLTPEARARVGDPSTAVFVSERFEPERREALEREIAATGKVPCSVRTTTGQERFRLWTLPGAPDLCAK
jgi:hypothetical protein